jgi:uncharacterized protein YgiB involved in biofilm formation
MPLLVGYMLGRTLAGQPGFTPQPLYRTQGDSTFRTGDNRAVTSKTGVQSVPRSTTASAFKSSTTTRGGFGRTGAVYGSTSPGRGATTSGG